MNQLLFKHSADSIAEFPNKVQTEDTTRRSLELHNSDENDMVNERCRQEKCMRVSNSANLNHARLVRFYNGMRLLPYSFIKGGIKDSIGHSGNDLF